MTISTASDRRLRRSSNALLGSAAATGLLGIVFWQIAAHRWSAETIGRDGVLINTCVVIGTLSYLNLPYALVSLIPKARNASRLITSAYAGSALLAVVLASAVAMLRGRWGLPSMTTPTAVAFVALAALSCIFALQDPVLTALGRPAIIPAENILFSIAKICCVAFVPVNAVRNPVFMSWLIPIPVLILGVTRVMVRTVGVHRKTRVATEVVRWREHSAFMGGDLIGSLASTMLFGFLPLLVLALTDERRSGYFYAAYVIGAQLPLVGLFIGLGFTAEASREPERLVPLARAALWRAVLLTSGIAVVLLLAAPIVLSLYGADYANEGAATLRLLAVAAIPTTIIAMYVAVGRVRRRGTRALVVQGGHTLLVLGIVVSLVRRYGPGGAGLALLVGSSTMAILVLPGLWRDLAGPSVRLGWLTPTTRFWPLGFQQGQPLSRCTVWASAACVALPALAAIGTPAPVRLVLTIVAMLLFPGLLATRLSDAFDAKWTVVIVASLSIWLLLGQMMLASGWWRPLILASVMSAAVLTRFIVWSASIAPARAQPNPLHLRTSDR